MCYVLYEFVCFDALCPNQQFFSHVGMFSCLTVFKPKLRSRSSILPNSTTERRRHTFIFIFIFWKKYNLMHFESHVAFQNA